MISSGRSWALARVRFFPRGLELKIKLPYVFQFTLLYASGIFLILLSGNLTVSTLSLNFVTARRTFPDLS